MTVPAIVYGVRALQAHVDYLGLKPDGWTIEVPSKDFDFLKNMLDDWLQPMLGAKVVPIDIRYRQSENTMTLGGIRFRRKLA